MWVEELCWIFDVRGGGCVRREEGEMAKDD